MPTYVHQKIRTWVFIAALYAIAKNWKQPKCLSRAEWIHRSWNSHTRKHLIVTGWNELQLHVTPWMNLTNMSSKRSQTQKTTLLIDLMYIQFKNIRGNSLVVQWLGPCTFTATAEGMGSIPGQGSKIPQGARRSQKERKTFWTIVWSQESSYPLGGISVIGRGCAKASAMLVTFCCVGAGYMGKFTLWILVELCTFALIHVLLR